jgi:hypothetical protein
MSGLSLVVASLRAAAIALRSERIHEDVNEDINEKVGGVPQPFPTEYDPCFLR